MSLNNRIHTGIVVLVFTIVVVLVGCGGGGSRDDGFNPERAQTRTLTGTVMSDSFAASVRDDMRFASGMNPVSGAKVWLETSPDTAPVYTDASGTYVFKGISAAEHFIVASFNHNNKVYKQRVRALVQAIDAEVTASPIGLEEAGSVLTGVLRDSSGEFIPAGTEAKLWGETFTVGTNGRFRTPELPNSVSQAQIFVKVPGSSDFTSFYGSFVPGTTPAFVEQTLMPAQAENQAPSGSLVAKNSIGVSTVKCVTNEHMNLTLSVFDPDPTHADRLTMSWNATRGSLQVAGDRKSATWTAMETHGVATISVTITDPEQASGKVSLRMLVGVDSMEETDTTPPVVAARIPAAGATAVGPDTSVSVEFSKALLPSSVTSGAITVSYQGTALSGTSTLQSDGKTILWTPGSALSGNHTYSVSLLSTISDLYGNQLGSVNAWTFTTTIMPVVTVNTLHTNDSTPLLTGTVDDPEATVAVTVGGNTYNATVSGTDWAAVVTQALADGVYNVSVKATNSDGVSGYDKTSNELHIDTVPKTAELSNKPAALTGRAQIEITVGGTGVTRYRYKLNDEAWSGIIEIAEPISRTLAEGEHVIRVIAGDAAGNWQPEASATTYNWTLDTSIKIAELENTPPTLTNQTQVEITVTGTGVTKYRYRLNDGSWTGEIPVSTKITFATLDSGSHILRVIGGDDAGNWQSEDEPTVVEWVIDATAKTALLPSFPSPTNQTEALITVEGSGVTKYRYHFQNNDRIIDWGDEFEISQPIVLEELVDGTQTLKVIGGDDLGNWQTISNATVKSWVVDTADVTVTITRRADQPELSNATTLYFVAQFNKPVSDFDGSDVVLSGDAGADTVQVSTAASPADGSRYEIAVSGMISDGIVEISIPENSAQDAAGNFNLASDNSEDNDNRVTFDTSPAAVVRVTSTNDDGYYAQGATIVLTVEFNKEVNVVGQPLLVLEVKDGGANAHYTGREENVLSFSYTVADGDNSEDLDYAGVESLKLNGSIIKDMAGNDAELSLPAPGHADSISGHKNIAIDTKSPAISTVRGADGDGAYKVGDAVLIEVEFDEPVEVTGVPYLTLNLENGHRFADYDSGSETDTLVFKYIVQDGDHSMDLDYVGTQALVLYNSSTIKDLAGNTALLVLAEPGETGSLGDSSNIEIRGVRPKIIGVTSAKPNGTYGTGKVIDVVIQFDANVTFAGGTPSLFLNTSPEQEINYSSGNGTTDLTFEYTVQENDTTAGLLDYRGADALALNGATVVDLAGNEADLTLPTAGFAGSLAANKSIIIDGVKPIVERVSGVQSNGNFKEGDQIDITVKFDKIVKVEGSPQLLVALDSGDYPVSYFSGNNTNTLYFRYIVQSGNVASHLDYPYAGALELNGGSITDIGGNEAVLTLPPPGEAGSLGASRTYVIDALAPTVLAVSSAIADGTYPAGEVIPISIQFSEVVRVSGTPQLTLSTTPERYAEYASGHNSDTLVFNYTIQAGDTTEAADLDYSSTSALALNGGSLRDTAGNNAVLTLVAPGAEGSLSHGHSIVIDGVLPEVDSVSSDEADGTYILGDELQIKVIFNEAVTVTGSPILTLATNSPNSVATYTSGSPGTDLIFTYIVQPGDSSSDLDYANTSSLSLNGGTIKNTVGNSADLTLSAPGSEGSLSFGKDLVINGIQPKITNVTSDKDDGTYKAGESINIMVHFDKTVNVVGTPVLELNSGDSVVAAYDSGSTSDVLTFIYLVGADENSADLDYFASSSLRLEGGSIVGTDPANDAYLILPAPGTTGSLAANKDIVIDTKAPEVTNVTSNLADGTYYFGKVIDLIVTFDEIVIVDSTGGNPTLKLSTGSIDRNATYQSGSGSNSLVFRYTVQTDDEAAPLDYVADANALALNGATIEDAVGNGADLALPAPGSSGSLSANKSINVNGARPRVADVTSSNENDTYTSGTISIQVEFSEVVTVTGVPQLELNVLPQRFAGYASGNNTNTLTFTYDILAGDSTDSHPLDYASTGALTLNGGTIENGNGVEAILLLSPPGDPGSLGNNKVIIIDAPAP